VKLSLDKYLQEIGKVDLITADEEVELAQKIKAGDQGSRKINKSKFTFRCFGKKNTKIKV
jgi:RNA polymerase primary sigma factor